MVDKHLPIQFFEKRKDYDDRSTEGGGDSKFPSWVLKGSDLLQRSSMLMTEICELSEEFNPRNMLFSGIFFLSFFVTFRIIPDKFRTKNQRVRISPL